MAGFYRWNRYSLLYSQSIENLSGVQVTIPDTSRMYYSSSAPSFNNSTGKWSGFSSFATSFTEFIRNYYFSTSSSSSVIYFCNYPSNVVFVNGEARLATSGEGYFQKKTSVPQKGNFIEYVYSNSSSTYPNGGASGSYYYSDMVEINYPVLTVPSIAMQNQNITINWTSGDSAINSYVLQRKSNLDDNWVEVYSGNNLTFTEQIGAWTQVQYQIAGVINGETGNFIQSSIIPIVDSSVLVISGSDGNLGTLTSNLSYTVSSNTGNPISLTRTVNGAQVVTLTVKSGFAYSIPIADLPTGTGTIQITASVKNGSETVTQTRTWTYYKTPINIPSTGGIAQLTQNGQNIWPVTVPDAVEAPVYLGGNLNAALNKLGQAALYTKIGSPKYNQVTVDLSKVKVGDEVLLPENDVMVPHIVVQIGNPDASMYDSSCDGVWLLRKDCVATGQWNSTNINTLAGSTIMSTMAGYVANYGTEVQSAIKTVKIPYITGNGNTTLNNLSNGLECQLFPLSVIECGIEVNQPSGIYSDGAKLSYFLSGTSSNANAKRISNKNWWPRSILTTSPIYVELFYANGAWDLAVWRANYANAQNGIRPCFIMPTTFNQTYYVDSSNNIHPAQEYTQGGSITDVFGYDVPICQYETGSYVGTGTSGPSNPNTLTFSFKPKIVFIDGSNEEILSGKGQSLSMINMASNTAYVNLNNGGITMLYLSWSGNSVSYWHPTNSNFQFNKLGNTYNYIAIG